MQHDCAQYPQSFPKATDALETIMASGIFDCRQIYVEKRTDYGAFILYGLAYSDCIARHRYL